MTPTQREIIEPYMDAVLYTAPQAQQPAQKSSTCGRCVVFCQGGDGCLSGMPQITQIEHKRLVCGQLSRRIPPADVPMLDDDWIIDMANEVHRAMPAGRDEQDELIAIVRKAEKEIRQKAGLK